MTMSSSATIKKPKPAEEVKEVAPVTPISDITKFSNFPVSKSILFSGIEKTDQEDPDRGEISILPGDFVSKIEGEAFIVYTQRKGYLQFAYIPMWEKPKNKFYEWEGSSISPAKIESREVPSTLDELISWGKVGGLKVRQLVRLQDVRRIKTISFLFTSSFSFGDFHAVTGELKTFVEGRNPQFVENIRESGAAIELKSYHTNQSTHILHSLDELNDDEPFMLIPLMRGYSHEHFANKTFLVNDQTRKDWIAKKFLGILPMT